MKWIKLFEGFNQDTKIKWVNDIFFYFKIRKKINAMKLKKIDARKYIYFYTKSSSFSSNLKFVYSKEDNQLSYHMDNASKDFKLEGRGGIKYRLSNYNLNKIRSIFEKLLKDHLSQYINVDFLVSAISPVYWADYKENFRKLKKG